MDFDSMIYLSVKPRLPMKNVEFSDRQRLKVSFWNHLFKVYIYLSDYVERTLIIFDYY